MAEVQEHMPEASAYILYSSQHQRGEKINGPVCEGILKMYGKGVGTGKGEVLGTSHCSTHLTAPTRTQEDLF